MPVTALYWVTWECLASPHISENVLASTLQESVTFQMSKHERYAILADWYCLEVCSHLFHFPFYPFLIGPHIVLDLSDNKGNKCNAYCKSLWLGLGHAKCQPMINWLRVCSISNAKLWREKRVWERKEHDGEWGTRQSEICWPFLAEGEEDASDAEC